MGHMGLPFCDFVVWTPTELQITRVPFDEDFWTNTLLPGLHTFYFDRYVPALVARNRGELQRGEISKSEILFLP